MGIHTQFTTSVQMQVKFTQKYAYVQVVTSTQKWDLCEISKKKLK